MISLHWCMTVIAQGTEALGPTLGPWANLTAVAALILLLVWMVTKFMPQLMKEQREEREKIAAVERQERMEQRDSFLQTIHNRDVRIEGLVQAQNKAVNDATVALTESNRMMRETTAYIQKLKKTEPSVHIHSPGTVEVKPGESGVLSHGN